MIKPGVLFVSLVTALSLPACSGGHNPDLKSISVSGKHTVITGTSFEVLEYNGGPPKKQEFLLASQPLTDVRSASHFQFTVALEPGGQALLSAFGEKNLAAHSSTTPPSRSIVSLANSVTLRFERPTDKTTLAVFLTASGTTDDWSEFFKNLDPAKPLLLGVDIHNNESGEAHVLVWNLEAGDKPNSPTLVDSALDVNGSPGKGFGRYWGISLADAELLAARLTPPRYDH